MEIDVGRLHWPAIVTCVVVGQVVLTVWFVVLFGTPWARAYGATSRAQHTKEIPSYTYAIGAVCTLLLTVGLAVLQASLNIMTGTDGLVLGLFVALCFSVATAVPGYAFLRRWPAGFMAIGSQTLLIVIVSVILAAWQKP